MLSGYLWSATEGRRMSALTFIAILAVGFVGLVCTWC